MFFAVELVTFAKLRCDRIDATFVTTDSAILVSFGVYAAFTPYFPNFYSLGRGPLKISFSFNQSMTEPIGVIDLPAPTSMSQPEK